MCLFGCQVPDDIQAMKVPALFLCAETDAQFPEQKRTAAMQVSQQTAPGGSVWNDSRHMLCWDLAQAAVHLGWVCLALHVPADV